MDHFNKLYKNDAQVFGDGKPVRIVEMVPHYVSSGSVLDVGAGQGRNTLFLARKGFRVVSLDTSEVALKQLKSATANEALPVEVIVSDIRKLDIDAENYDIVVFSFVLHLFFKEVSERILKYFMHNTRRGALHTISAFTSEGDFFKDPKNKAFYYPAPGELKEFYERNGWEVLEYYEEEVQTLRKHPDGTPMKNLTSFLLATKR